MMVDSLFSSSRWDTFNNTSSRSFSFNPKIISTSVSTRGCNRVGHALHNLLYPVLNLAIAFVSTFAKDVEEYASSPSTLDRTLPWRHVVLLPIEECGRRWRWRWWQNPLQVGTKKATTTATRHQLGQHRFVIFVAYISRWIWFDIVVLCVSEKIPWWKKDEKQLLCPRHCIGVRPSTVHRQIRVEIY